VCAHQLLEGVLIATLSYAYPGVFLYFRSLRRFHLSQSFTLTCQR
jgi:hypothetical protein